MHEFMYTCSANPMSAGCAIKLATWRGRASRASRSRAINHESTPTDGNPRSYCRTRRHEPGAAPRAAQEPGLRGDAGDAVPGYPGPGARQVSRRWSLSAEPGAARRARPGGCSQTCDRRVPPQRSSRSSSSWYSRRIQARRRRSRLCWIGPACRMSSGR